VTIDVIAEVLEETLGCTKKEARRITLFIIYAITKELTNKHRMMISRFGTFQVARPKSLTNTKLSKKLVEQIPTVKFHPSIILRKEIAKRIKLEQASPQARKTKRRAFRMPRSTTT
jgi:nucleoid DNA-binding protein